MYDFCFFWPEWQHSQMYCDSTRYKNKMKHTHVLLMQRRKLTMKWITVDSMIDQTFCARCFRLQWSSNLILLLVFVHSLQVFLLNREKSAQSLIKKIEAFPMSSSNIRQPSIKRKTNILTTWDVIFFPLSCVCMRVCCYRLFVQIMKWTVATLLLPTSTWFSSWASVYANEAVLIYYLANIK